VVAALPAFLEGDAAKANSAATLANESRLIITSRRRRARREAVMLFMLLSFYGVFPRGQLSKNDACQDLTATFAGLVGHEAWCFDVVAFVLVAAQAYYSRYKRSMNL
jgi:hypothetical protein